MKDSIYDIVLQIKLLAVRIQKEFPAVSDECGWLLVTCAELLAKQGRTPENQRESLKEEGA